MTPWLNLRASVAVRPEFTEGVTEELKGNTIRIRVVDYLNDAPSQVERSDGLLEVYSSADIDYYIMDNEDQLQAVWIIDNYECCIIGPLTLPEIKQIIDSIGKV